ncbi:Hypothetical protein NTJ_07048 [Nesidiocoris tenuis]|uniref:CTNNB1 binding N-teminal domain-containing protein n=1 Tax=Nesidiocoris tenuis TaxID=355587 RepID=A0ABN7APV1_9HEMI|nr:Hypothetical protein NTJ_07048 [Nesidiocoris tenuis]
MGSGDKDRTDGEDVKEANTLGQDEVHKFSDVQTRQSISIEAGGSRCCARDAGPGCSKIDPSDAGSRERQLRDRVGAGGAENDLQRRAWLPTSPFLLNFLI